jgi:GMP synthase (glutamine-hydrolysing)
VALQQSTGSPRISANTSQRHDRILILDFGSQVTQLIARRVREAGVYSELHPYDVSAEFIRDFQPRGVILSGSHASVYEGDTPRAPQVVFELGVPVLGICYGMQTMAAQLGGRVEMGRLREFGYAEVRARGHTRLLKDIQDSKNSEGHGLLNVWMSHGDNCGASFAKSAVALATGQCPTTCRKPWRKSAARWETTRYCWDYPAA